MDREYDIYEKLVNGEMNWHGAYRGRISALARLKEIAATSSNEVFAIHVPTKEIIATLNAKKP
jgi:uncharacterized hydantoinase/oxoprolinase family protein